VAWPDEHTEPRFLQLRELQKNLVTPAVLSRTDPMLSREYVRSKAQCSHAAERSRQNVGKRALDSLHEGHRLQRSANLRTKERAMASAKLKLESDASDLASKHVKEAAESQTAKVALIQEFDVKREAWAVASKADVKKLLIAEGLQHASLIESLKEKKLRDDEEAQRVLHEIVQGLERSGQSSFWYAMTRNCAESVVY